MNNNNNPEMNDDLREEYDFSQFKDGVKGKYVERYRTSDNVIFLDPDVVQAFPTSEAVNEALRLLIKVAATQGKDQEQD